MAFSVVAEEESSIDLRGCGYRVLADQRAEQWKNGWNAGTLFFIVANAFTAAGPSAKVWSVWI